MKLLVLDATNKSITAVMSGAAATTNPDFVTTYADSTSSSFTEVPNDGTLNGTTPVTIVASPAASTRRVITDMVIFNRDSAAVTVTIKYVSGANTRTIWQGVIQPNESSTIDGVFDSNGNLKTAPTFTATTGSGNIVLATNPSISMAGGSIVIPATASALATTEGAMKWDSTLKQMALYDGARERTISPIGFQPFAHPMNYVYNSTYTTALALVANGGSVIMPVLLHASMLLESVSVVNTDTTLARAWGWDLYIDRSNGSNSVNRITNSSADDSFTSGGQSVRTITAASAPVYLAPGVYWLVIQCRHATNTFGVGTQAGSGTTNFTSIKTKTTTNPNGSTLDIIAATWATSTATAAVKLNGRVAANTVAW